MRGGTHRLATDNAAIIADVLRLFSETGKYTFIFFLTIGLSVATINANTILCPISEYICFLNILRSEYFYCKSIFSECVLK